MVLALVAVAACSSTTADVPHRPVAAASIHSDIHLAPDTLRVQGLVPRNATLAAMLRAEGLATEVVDGIVGAARTVFDPRRLRSNQPFAIERTVDGVLRYFEYEIDGDSVLRVVPADPAGADELRAEVLPIPKTLEHGATAGTIDRSAPSLFQAMSAAGERPELAVEIARVFAGDIDFNNEVQLGDRFAVAFERFTREDRPEAGSSYGVITAVEFENKGRVLRAVRFTPPGGRPGYYDIEGRSLQRFFLRSPLKFEPRITSRFSARRMHPVLHTARAHTGVDYAAPHGSEVVAAAGGTVVSATFDNTNGRMVRLRHASGYESYYLHLSAFAPGIRAGVRVEQGQFIGRVGATGLATGPHLHYGLRRNGQWVDPLREHSRMPPGDPIPEEAMAAFLEERDRALEQLDLATRESFARFRPDAPMALTRAASTTD
jgi:murein DD-endopeptidase MepM/ murein hydrolase activator NlpD